MQLLMLTNNAALCPERSYYGGPSHECPYCGAVFWYQERVKRDSAVSQRRIVYNLCCRGGKISLPELKYPPDMLAKLLKFDGDAQSKRFLRQIRSYNSLFAFTSLGADVEKSINNGTAPYVFKINGVVHHRIGSLLPQCGAKPKFAQLYIYDTENETANRINIFDRENSNDEPDPSIVTGLGAMLDQHNDLVKSFRYARDRLNEHGNEQIALRLLGCNAKDEVQYNLPTSGEIAGIIVGDSSNDAYTYDVVVQSSDNRLRQVSALHPSYMALQYPLLFPYGERGFHLGIKYTDFPSIAGTSRRYVTMLEYYRYRFHYRLNKPNPYTCCGRLSDSICVDAYSTVEGSRLKFIHDHQPELRSECVQGIADAIDHGLESGDSVGKKYVLPSSFTGGRRYMVQNYQDAMAVCRVFGSPDLFVTFTCNSKWQEIYDALVFEPGQVPSDRSDMIVRVFSMKVDEFISDIKEGRTFGPVLAGRRHLDMFFPISFCHVSTVPADIHASM